jgi:hypothetical protein
MDLIYSFLPIIELYTIFISFGITIQYLKEPMLPYIWQRKEEKTGLFT